MKKHEPKITVVSKIQTKVIGLARRRPVKYDYLKNLTVVRQWVKNNHGLSDKEFELILFLYSEKLFTKNQIRGYSTMFTWDKDRFYKMIKDGWIHEYTVRTATRLPVYELTKKAKLVVTYVYKMLSGEADLPIDVKSGISQKRNPGEKSTTLIPGTKRGGAKGDSRFNGSSRVV